MVKRHRPTNMALHTTGFIPAGKLRVNDGALSIDPVGAERTVTVMVAELFVADGVIDGGLKSHLIHAGWPLQRKFTAAVKTLELTLTAKFLEAPTASSAELG
jgi:hypothetical protein